MVGKWLCMQGHLSVLTVVSIKWGLFYPRALWGPCRTWKVFTELVSSVMSSLRYHHFLTASSSQMTEWTNLCTPSCFPFLLSQRHLTHFFFRLSSAMSILWCWLPLPRLVGIKYIYTSEQNEIVSSFKGNTHKLKFCLIYLLIFQFCIYLLHPFLDPGFLSISCPVVEIFQVDFSLSLYFLLQSFLCNLYFSSLNSVFLFIKFCISLVNSVFLLSQFCISLESIQHFSVAAFPRSSSPSSGCSHHHLCPPPSCSS